MAPTPAKHFWNSIWSSFQVAEAYPATKRGGVGFPTPIHMSRLKCIDHKKRGIHPSPSPGSVNELCPLKWLYRKILVSKGLFICIHIYMYIHLSLTQICKPWANVIEIHVWQNKWYIELRSKVERYFSKDFEMTALHCTYFNWLFKLMKVNFLTEVTFQDVLMHI